MVTDDDILEKEDLYILTRMKEFASNEEVVTFAAAKQLLILIGQDWHLNRSIHVDHILHLRSAFQPCFPPPHSLVIRLNPLLR